LKKYKLWTDLPYAGEDKPPSNPVDPLAWSWSTEYIQLNAEGQLKDRTAKTKNLRIQNPHKIEWNRQLEIVQETLENITDEQIQIAKYWGAGAPTKQWTPIIDRLIDTYSVTPPMAGRILKAVHAGINDTNVVTWYVKFRYNVARPNQLDHDLATILCTPRFPTYVAGHASVAGCAEVILSYFFPPESSRLKTLAEECALSRLYAGVHFPVDLNQGLRLGRQIGHIVVHALKKEENSAHEKIDVPFKQELHAQLPPPPYVQAIPFIFDTPCQSKVRQ
jgi:hypothetical protein